MQRIFYVRNNSFITTKKENLIKVLSFLLYYSTSSTLTDLITCGSSGLS
jgi:hypothetical protein